MFKISDLKTLIEHDVVPVVVRDTGEVHRCEGSAVSGPVTMLVVPVSDALKMVSDEGMVTGRVDRETVWRVTAVVMDADAARRLEEGDHDLTSLCRQLDALGYRPGVERAD